MRTVVSRLGKAHQGRITHQVTDPTMKMRGGVIDVLAVFDADEIRNLRRVIQTPIPAGDAAAADLPRDKNPRYLTEGDVRQALERHGGNKTRAAAALGIAVNTLKARMRAFGLKS